MPLKKLTKRRSTSRVKRQSLATDFNQRCSVKKGKKSCVKRKPKQPKRKSNAQNLRRSARIKSLSENRTKTKEEIQRAKPSEDPPERDAFLNLTTPLQTPSSSNQPVDVKPLSALGKRKRVKFADSSEPPPKKPGLPSINICSLFGNPEVSSPCGGSPPIKRFVTPTFQTSPQPPSNHKRRKQSNLNSTLFEKRKLNVLYLGDEPQDYSNIDESVTGFENPFLQKDSRNLTTALDLKIDLRQTTGFVDVKQIGRGDFGTVFQAVHSVDGCKYAIKKTPLQSNSQKSRRLALKECNVLSYLKTHGQCPYIVGYCSSWENDMTVCMQMEFCEQGSVKERHYSKERLIEAEIWKLFTQISIAIKFLHDHNIAHLDVKPENMLIHANGDYRLADFGHATWINCDSRNIVFQVDDGDRRYLAYELLQDDLKHLGAADIFSLALSMIELLTTELPHNGAEWRSLRGGRIRRNLNCRKEFKSILVKMMKAEPTKRVVPSELLRQIGRHEHLYMSDR